ncbi:MAG: response regulator transcription factor [Planctomycetaceae bacterium]
MIRIAIIDDHPVTRKGLATMIALERDMEVCGEAENIGQALKLIQETSPDLAIIDVSLKSGNGIDLVARLREQECSVRMLVCSMYEESLYADRALRAGAMGYINKDASTETIVAAIRRIMTGKVYLSPEMSERMLHRMVLGKTGVQESPLESLSDRELETFQWMGHGLTTSQIADQMCLSPKTVETYRARIKDKLGVDSMPELTRRAAQWVIENG